MKKYILLFVINILLISCSQTTDRWKNIEIVGVCKFSIPEKLQCDDNNEFIKELKVDKDNNFCKVSLKEEKSHEKNILAFINDDARKYPYKIAVSFDENDIYSEKFTESVMAISNEAIPYLEKKLLDKYIKYENITNEYRDKFEWMPIKLVNKDKTSYVVVEYKMFNSERDEIVRVVHTFFIFDGQRVTFSIYCDEKALKDSEEYFMKFVESISFDNLNKKNYKVYSDINTTYNFKFPQNFTMLKRSNRYEKLGYSETISLRAQENTIDVNFYERLDNNKIDSAKYLFKNLFPNITFNNITKKYNESNELQSIDFNFDSNNDDYFTGNGVILFDISTIIINAILDPNYIENGNEAMNMIKSSLKTINCTYSSYIP